MINIATVETEARIGDVIPEKSIEIRISRIASSVLMKTDVRIGQKKSSPLWKNKIPYSTAVERRVTTTVVSVNPRHLPIITSV